MLADGLLGRYKIIKKIGTGGMGEVYLGEDSKLNRKIALKTLPADVGADSERMRRFTREAKSASALNHPNIITIYEINDEDQIPFIAMEYVEGETLGKIIKRSPPELAAAVDIAIQVAGALAAAHEANVVHRDVKPDNIIVRPDGLVKMLDFGLAKLSEGEVGSDPEAETVAHRTNPGMIIGTASYMSPEQARGKQVDGRSDIFSFGTVLYQMFTGKLPFVGENYVDVIALVLHQDPPPMADAAPDVPHQIESIVRKCLRKDRDERFQSMRELLADLRDVQQVLGLVSRSGQRLSASSDPGTNRTTGEAVAWPFTTDRHSRFHTGSISKMLLSEVRLHPVRVLTVLTALIAVIGFGGIGLKKLGDVSTTAEAFQKMRFTKVTTSGTVVSGLVSLSNDGRFVAYTVQDAGKRSLLVKQAETESLVQAVLPSDIDYSGIFVSPDSKFIYYLARNLPESASLYQVPVFGGTPRKLVSDVEGSITFSPDGSKISYIRQGTDVMIANADGGSPTKLATAQNGDRWKFVAWSPNGDKLMTAVYSSSDSKDRLIEIDLSDGMQHPVAVQPWYRIGGLAWMPHGKGLVITARDFETQYSQIWQISYPNGDLRRITNDLTNYQGLSLSVDGTAIAAVQETRIANVWKGSVAEPTSADKITFDVGRDEGMSGVAWAPDGSVIYTVRARGMQDIWIADPNGTRSQLTFSSNANFSPEVSPDGRYIVFVSTRSGNPSLWRMDISGENAVQLTNQQGVAAEPDITPDGKWIVYQLGDPENKDSIWKISIDGGDPVMLSIVDATRPEVSPDGKWIACEYGKAEAGKTPSLAILPIEGGQPAKVLDFKKVISSRNYHWSSDGTGIIYVDGVNKVDNLWFQPLDSKPAKQLTFYDSERIYRFDVSKIDGSFAMSRGNQSSDVILLTNFQ